MKHGKTCWVSIMLMACVASLSVCAWSQTSEPITSAGAPAEDLANVVKPSITLTISGTDAAEAMSMLSEATGYSVILSSKVAGKLNAFIRDMDPDQALAETCKVNGLDYVKNGNVVWVLTHDEYVQDFQMGRERRVVVLKYAKASEVAQTLSNKSLLSKDAVVIPYVHTNAVLIAEQSEKLKDAMDLIVQLDQPRATRVFPLQCASASDLLSLIQSYASTPTAVQADLRTNQLMITETDSNLSKIEELIRQLDQPDRMQTRVFALCYAQADNVAQILREVLTGSKTSQSSISNEQRTSKISNITRTATSSFEGARTATSQPITDASAGAERQAPSAPKIIGKGTGATATTASGEAPVTDAGIGRSGIASPATPTLPTPAVMTTSTTGVNGQETALGPLATVVSDPRTNSVIVTHTTSILDRLAQIVASVDVPSDLHVFQFQNADPTELEVETKLQDLLPRDNAYVNVDAAGRKVTFRSSTKQAEEILGLLRQWDETVRQVHIEAEILSVNATLIRQLGIRWQAVLDKVDDAGTYTRGSAAITFPPVVGDTDNQAHLSIGNLDRADYNALIQALTTDNDTHIIASPRILARDGKEASFSSTRDEPYTVVTVNGDTNTTLQDVRFLNIGTTLRVKPVINSEGLINLQVQLEQSSLVEIRSGVPVVDRSTAESSVSVRDSGTVILGGLRQRTRKEAEQGVPGLRKMPLLGNLFKNNEKTNTEQEIILVLRPVISGPTCENPPTISTAGKEVNERINEKRLGLSEEKRKP